MWPSKAVNAGVNTVVLLSGCTEPNVSQSLSSFIQLMKYANERNITVHGLLNTVQMIFITIYLAVTRRAL